MKTSLLKNSPPPDQRGISRLRPKGGEKRQPEPVWEKRNQKNPIESGRRLRTRRRENLPTHKKAVSRRKEETAIRPRFPNNGKWERGRKRPPKVQVLEIQNARFRRERNGQHPKSLVAGGPRGKNPGSEWSVTWLSYFTIGHVSTARGNLGRLIVLHQRKCRSQHAGGEKNWKVSVRTESGKQAIYSQGSV